MRILLFILLAALRVYAEGPEIIFEAQHQPASGIPPEARSQERTNSMGAGSQGSLSLWLQGCVKALRVEYYNKATWKGEVEVKAYLAALATNRFTELYGFQVWSELVGTPEIECRVDFTEDYQKNAASQGSKSWPQGRLLLWNTEACFRDGRGRWWFVTVFDHFHRLHPRGDRALARTEAPK